MNLGRVWDIVHTILKKESRGNIIKPGRFTYELQQVNLEYFNRQYEKWAASQTSEDSLGSFVEVDESVTFSSGSAAISSLSETYIHLIAARDGDDNKIQVVPPHVWNEWIGDSVMTGTTDYPIMTKDNTGFKIYPTTITSVKMSYLRQPVDPVFDYYIDANYTVQYLEVGEEYSLNSDETYSDDTAGASGTSASVDFEWGDQDIVNIITLILQKRGVAMQASDIVQYSMALEQQQDKV